jgi:hypothetical protein
MEPVIESPEPSGLSGESFAPREALLRDSKERTFATLGLAWRVARLVFAPQSLAQPPFPDKRFHLALDAGLRS